MRNKDKDKKTYKQGKSVIIEANSSMRKSLPTKSVPGATVSVKENLSVISSSDGD